MELITMLLCWVLKTMNRCLKTVLGKYLCMNFQTTLLILEDSNVWVVSKFNQPFIIAKFSRSSALCNSPHGKSHKKTTDKEPP